MAAINASHLRNTQEALKGSFMLAVRADGEIVLVAFGANEPIVEADHGSYRIGLCRQPTSL